MSRARKRTGFSLLEVLCVMALLAIVGGILILLLRETLGVERAQAEGFERIVQGNTLVDQFRSDVAQAEKAPPSWEAFKADPHTLILEMKKNAYVVYLWQKDRLQRRTYAGNKLTGERTLPLPSQISVEFVRADADSKLVRLRLHRSRGTDPLPGQSLEIAAALGGDWR
jgi:prepilin-type N-terminal cleavage/methylation domain-containing protein